jgi:hypothetical protein
MHIVNLLDKNTSGINSVANGGLGNWVAGNATLVRSTKRSHSGISSVIIDAGTLPVVYSGSELTYVPVNYNTEYGYRGFVWFHSENPGDQINFGFQFYDSEKSLIAQTSAHHSTFTMSYAEWDLASIFVDPDNTPEDARWMALVVKPSNNSKTWIDDAVIYESELVTTEPFIQKLVARLPEYFVEEDASQTSPEYPLLNYLDSAAFTLGHIDELITEFGFYSMGDATHPEATSTLVDPATFTGGTAGIQHDWLLWLSRIIGVQSDAISDSSGNASNWSQLDANYDTWTKWEEDINPATLDFSQSWTAVKRTNNVVTVTFNPGSHVFKVGDSIYTVTSGGNPDASLYGYFEITEVITSPSYQIKFVQTGTNPDIAFGDLKTGKVETKSDVNWQSIENSNSYPLTPPQALAKFIETGASGVWAGTLEGMRRAARVVLNGLDIPISFIVADGVLTATSSTAHNLSVGDEIKIYGCPFSEYNRSYLVASVLTNTTFTVACDGPSLISKGHVTNKFVDFERGYWNGDVNDATRVSNTVTLIFKDRIPVFSVTGNIVITGNSILVGTFALVSPVVSADRYSMTFIKSGSDFTETNLIATKAKLDVGSRFCFMAQTLESQTTGAESVIEFTNFAKPAGGIITHEYA